MIFKYVNPTDHRLNSPILENEKEGKVCVIRLPVHREANNTTNKIVTPIRYFFLEILSKILKQKKENFDMKKIVKWSKFHAEQLIIDQKYVVEVVSK